MRGRRKPSLLIALALVVATACSEEDTRNLIEPGAATYLTPTSPASVLTNLATAYEARDIHQYKSTTHEDFVFVPSDSVDPGLDELTRAEDRQSTLNMFTSVRSIDVRLDFEDPVPSDLPAYPESEGYRMIRVPSVRIEVVTMQFVDGEQLVHLIDGEPALFVFAKDTSSVPTTYSIVYQQDLTGIEPSARVDRTTWGSLKAAYRTPGRFR